MNLKAIGLTLATLLWPCSIAAAQAPVYSDPNDHSAYVLAVSKIGKPERSATGTVVDANGHIITASALIGKDTEESWSVRLPGASDSIPAKVLTVDHELGTALLQADAALLTAHATFAKADLTANSPIRSLSVERAGVLTASEGSVSNTSLPPTRDPAVQYLLHTAQVTPLGFGGPLVNRCGDLVGMTVASPLLSVSRARRLDVPSGDAYALDREPLLQFLLENGISTSINAQRCLTNEEEAEKLVAQAAASEKEKQKSADELDEAKQRLEQLEQQKLEAEKKAEEAKREAERRRKEADRLKDDANATKEQRDDAEKAAKEAEEIAERASIDISDYTLQIGTLRTDIVALETEIKKVKRRFYIAVAAGVVSALLIALLLSTWLIRRGAKLRVTENGLAEANQELSKTFPDIECRGIDAQNAAHAFRITGAALLRSPGGLIIGRQPASASIVINHPEVSREHTRVTLRDGKVWVEDLDTTNGTTVNGEKLISGKPVMVADGDTFAVGSITFTVRFIDV